MSFLLRKLFKLIKNTFLVASAISIIVTLMNITAYTVLFYDTNISIAFSRLINNKNFCDFFNLIYKSSSLLFLLTANISGVILFVCKLVKEKIERVDVLEKVEILSGTKNTLVKLNKNIVVPLRI